MAAASHLVAPDCKIVKDDFPAGVFTFQTLSSLLRRCRPFSNVAITTYRRSCSFTADIQCVLAHLVVAQVRTSLQGRHYKSISRVSVGFQTSQDSLQNATGLQGTVRRPLLDLITNWDPSVEAVLGTGVSPYRYCWCTSLHKNSAYLGFTTRNRAITGAQSKLH